MSLSLCLVLNSVTTSTSTISININFILVLNGINFKNWKENVLSVLDCMDLNLSLWEERLVPLNEESSFGEKLNFENRDSFQLHESYDRETFHSGSF